MCGIIGEFSRANLVSEHNFRRLLGLMARRGPDDEGIWTDDQYCTLGLSRLAILDLSPAGHQPMLTRDGRFALVFNGELYNFRELRKELEAKGVRFRSTGDAEVVLYALAEWNLDALNRFNGMFALAFYDSANKRLLLARDHAGIKPLYTLRSEQGIFFASQYDQILRHPWSRGLAFSPAAMGLYLRLGYIPAPFAALEKTGMLPAGSWLSITADGDIQTGRFFEFPMWRPPDLFGEEAYEAVDAEIQAAVKRQLISDVPVGAFLSGGIDSPLVAANMKDFDQDGAFKAFTIGTGGDQYDESRDAAQYAREIGMAHEIRHITSEQALAMLDDTIAACGEPFADFSIFPTMLVSEMARKEVKVVLSGDGGDELFWGYASRFGSVLDIAPDFSQPYWFRSARWGLKKWFDIGNGVFDHRRGSIGEWYLAKHTYMNNRLARTIFPELPDVPADFEIYLYSGSSQDQTAQWLRWNEFVGHLERVLLKVDRASMYHSLEVRVPLLDRAVVELAARVDWRSCLDVGTRIGKIPLRRALGQRVNHQTTSKKGFMVPMNQWLRTSLRPRFESLLFDRTELAGLPIEPAALKAMYREHQTGKSDNAWSLWLIFSLGLWAERYTS
jgi:asparagine synthase (glutamine-hydrolysing)